MQLPEILDMLFLKGVRLVPSLLQPVRAQVHLNHHPHLFHRVHHPVLLLQKAHQQAHRNLPVRQFHPAHHHLPHPVNHQVLLYLLHSLLQNRPQSPPRQVLANLHQPRLVLQNHRAFLLQQAPLLAPLNLQVLQFHLQPLLQLHHPNLPQLLLHNLHLHLYLPHFLPQNHLVFRLLPVLHNHPRLVSVPVKALPQVQVSRRLPQFHLQLRLAQVLHRVQAHPSLPALRHQLHLLNLHHHLFHQALRQVNRLVQVLPPVLLNLRAHLFPPHFHLPNLPPYLLRLLLLNLPVLQFRHPPVPLSLHRHHCHLAQVRRNHLLKAQVHRPLKAQALRFHLLLLSLQA